MLFLIPFLSPPSHFFLSYLSPVQHLLFTAVSLTSTYVFAPMFTQNLPPGTTEIQSLTPSTLPQPDIAISRVLSCNSVWRDLMPSQLFLPSKTPLPTFAHIYFELSPCSHKNPSTIICSSQSFSANNTASSAIIPYRCFVWEILFPGFWNRDVLTEWPRIPEKNSHA